MGLTNTHRQILKQAIIDDDLDRFKNTLKILKHPLEMNEELSTGKCAVCLCSCYDSKKCLRYLIELGHDINMVEAKENDTPFILGCKFNFIDIVKILLEHKCDVTKINNIGLNGLDVAFIRGNYDICLYLIENTELKMKTLENYKALNELFNYPLFNMELFYQCLIDKIPCNNVPSFKVESKRKKMFEGKVPDPNETWSHFIKRLVKLELYQPPLIDKSNLQNEKKSFYMKLQTGLCEMEYGIDMKLGEKPPEIHSDLENQVEGELICIVKQKDHDEVANNCSEIKNKNECQEFNENMKVRNSEDLIGIKNNNISDPDNLGGDKINSDEKFKIKSISKRYGTDGLLNLKFNPMEEKVLSCKNENIKNNNNEEKVLQVNTSSNNNNSEDNKLYINLK